jgi:ribosomal protein S18 acetylase RimI-like enzyme
MNCVISDFKENDAEDIAVLNGELGYSVTSALVRKQIRRIQEQTRDRVFIAKIGEHAAGFIHLSPYELMFDDPLMNVMGLVVLEEYRRRGIASALMKHAERYAKENGFSGIRLNSGSDRTGAHAFYESLGYVSRKTHKHFIKRF